MRRRDFLIGASGLASVGALGLMPALGRAEQAEGKEERHTNQRQRRPSREGAADGGVDGRADVAYPSSSR